MNRNNSSDKLCLNAFELLGQINKDNQVRIVQSAVPFNKDVILKDISLNAKGMDEDSEYASNEFYIENIRRGNTIVEILENDRPRTSFIGRKGLKKFFDLHREYMDYNLSKSIKPLELKTGKKGENNKMHQSLHKYIFGAANQSLSSEAGSKVHIYKLVKANGENCQISFAEHQNGNMWIIASKNVALAASSKSDLEFYRQDRYYFAKLIAEEWFNLLSNKTQSEIRELEVFLKGRTLVGEYCGK